MNYHTTEELLETIKPYIENAKLSIQTETGADVVFVDKKHDVGFQVFENEIIVFYFTDHCHFEDYSSELEEGDPNYVERAKEFLMKLFRYQIRHIEFYRGKIKSSEKYYFIYDDGRKDECIGTTWFGFAFGKKRSETMTSIFDREKGCFSNHCPKSPSPEAVHVVDVSDDCYIEIFKRHNAYIYEIMETDYNEYHGMYQWVPACNIIRSGFYDTKERAIENAMEALCLKIK